MSGTSGLGQFEREVLDQHRPLLYMFLLGSPRPPFNS
jgi:hypothetical protein